MDYGQAYRELAVLRQTDPELAEKVAAEILGGIEKEAAFSGDAVKDAAGRAGEAIGGAATNARKEMGYAAGKVGDALGASSNEAAMQAALALDWIKKNPGKAGLAGAGVIGAGVGTGALINAIKNSKDEKVAAAWNDYLEKVASNLLDEKLANEAAGEILKMAGFFPDEETRSKARGAREAWNMEEEEYLNEAEMLANQELGRSTVNDGMFAIKSQNNRDYNKGLRALGTDPQYKDSVKALQHNESMGTLAGILGGVGGAAGTIEALRRTPSGAGVMLPLVAALGGSVGLNSLSDLANAKEVSGVDPAVIEAYLKSKGQLAHNILNK